MTRTILVTALLSAVAGAAVTGYTLPRAQNAAEEEQAAVQAVAPAPASQPRVQRAVYTQPAQSVRQPRSTEKSVMIVAGSAGAGAAIGGLAGGKKGAAIGAISGGVAGLIYDRHTANRR